MCFSPLHTRRKHHSTSSVLTLGTVVLTSSRTAQTLSHLLGLFEDQEWRTVHPLLATTRKWSTRGKQKDSLSRLSYYAISAIAAVSPWRNDLLTTTLASPRASHSRFSAPIPLTKKEESKKGQSSAYVCHL